MNTVFGAAMAAETSDTLDAADTAAAPIATAAPMQQVTVKSQRSHEAVSRAKQEGADNLITTVSQEEIRQLPDFNAGEAAARMPGASLSVDTGQGRWVNIRGLDADLTSTTYGGIHLPPTNPVTPQSGGRAFAMDTFPTGMIGSLTLTKTNKPEQDAEALGGTIEITPKAIPPGQDKFLEYRAGTGIQNSRSTPVTDLAVTGGIRWGGGDHKADTDSSPAYMDHPFSFVGSLTYYKDAMGTDDRRASFVDKPGTAPNMALSNITQAYYQFNRTTKGAGGELAWQPDADTRLYARYLYSGYIEDVARNRLVYNKFGSPVAGGNGDITSTLGRIDKSLRYMQEQVSLNVMQLGGERNIGDAKVDFNVANTQGKDFRPYDTIATYSNALGPGSAITYNQNDSSYPSYTVSANSPNGTPQTNPLTPSQYKLANYTNNTQTYLTKEWSTGANVTMPTHFTNASEETLKFGTSMRFRTNSHTWDPYTSTSVPTVYMDSAITGSPVTYYNGHYANGYNISQPYSAALFANGTGTGFATNNLVNQNQAAAVDQSNKENVYAVYGQEHFTFGNLGILAGVRVETTQAQFNGNQVAPVTISNPTGTVVPISASNSYSNVFPSLQARYEIRPDLVGRASFSTSIARPGFNQSNPAMTIDTANYVLSYGNPNLKPTTSQNFDLSIEHYLNQGGIVSAGLFDKELSNYIVARSSTGTNDPVAIAALQGAGLDPMQIPSVSYTNIAKARVTGLELNYDQKYTSLPGILSGLGTSFNYTFVDSKGDIRPGESGPLPSTSRNNANAAVYWQGEKLGMRLAASYVGRSLLFIGANAALDQYTEARLSADFSASYAINKNLSFYVSGRNLLNTAHTITEGSSNRVIQRETFGSAVLLGITGSM